MSCVEVDVHAVALEGVDVVVLEARRRCQLFLVIVER